MKKALGRLFFLFCIPLVPLVLLATGMSWDIHSLYTDRRRKRRMQQDLKTGKRPVLRNQEEEYDGKLQVTFFMVLYFGQQLREQLGFLWKTGRMYKRHPGPGVSAAARRLCRDSIEAILYLNHLRAGLELRRQFRRLVPLRDQSDLVEFWKLHFDSTYACLEETANQLASLLLEPDLHEDFRRLLTDFRPPMKLPTGPGEESRNELRRLKGTIRLMLRSNRRRWRHPIFRSAVGWNRRDGRSPHIELITAFARGRLRNLPEAEREPEAEEMESLLNQLKAGAKKGSGLAMFRSRKMLTGRR